MTRRRLSSRFTNKHAIAPMLLATCGLAACESYVGEGTSAQRAAQGSAGTSTETNASIGLNLSASAGTGGVDSVRPGNRTNTTNSHSSSPGMAPRSSAAGASAPPAAKADATQLTCTLTARKAEITLTTYCGGCHGPNSSAQGGFDTVLDVSALVATGKVVQNQPNDSPLWKRLSAGTMPPAPVANRPSSADIAAIEEWIACGAPDWVEADTQSLAFYDVDTRLRTVLADLRSIANPVDRERQRYIDFTALSNAGLSEEQLDIYRDAVSFLLNSLSRGRTVIAPAAVDQKKQIYRIDLRDYLWDEATWNQLEVLYPYAVIYDQDSRLYPFDEVASEQIREETNTQIPIIQADWFISHASRPPLYHTLLDLRSSLAGLEQDVGIDVQRNIETEQVLRAGFANAGPSQNNRVIERHELGGNRGAFWISYDFANNLDNSDVFANPLDFQEDGGEVIFNLENGLQAYLVVNAAGQRLDKAPNNVVQDPASRDGAVENGLSCMNCHQEDGILPKFDEIRDFQRNAGANAREIEDVLAIYVSRDELQAAFDKDQDRYRAARNALGIKHLTNTTLHTLDDMYLGVINLEGVASVMGIPSEDLRRSIDASPQSFPPQIVTLRTKGGGIQRDAFDAIVGELVTALGLGEQLRARNQVNNNKIVNNAASSNNGSNVNTRGGGGAGGTGANARTNNSQTNVGAGGYAGSAR